MSTATASPAPCTYWALRFVGGLLLLLIGGLGTVSMTLPIDAGSKGILNVALGAAGFWIAVTAVNPLVRALGQDLRLRRDWGPDAHAAFARASTPQRVYLLLLAVAEADGQSGPQERELVRTFLEHRFPDSGTRRDLDAWTRAARPPREVEALASNLAAALGRSECGTLYSWCCLIAFADGDLHPREFAVLQRIARGLDLDAAHAMFLFQFAQQASRRRGGARQERTGSASGAGRRQGAGTATAASFETARDRALATLGLPRDATPEQVRRRHRALVRQFHPDAQQRLGEVARQEATERFLLIQRAYEELQR
ncbi:MAG: TerB family tellurite resistance protein [Planctomycetota bacterium]